MATTFQELDLDLVTRGHLDKAHASLSEEFDGIYGSETVERFMVESLEAVGSARVQAFVPLFAHRFARERLRAAALEEIATAAAAAVRRRQR